jgi:arginyl-tRNA synthetase
MESIMNQTVIQKFREILNETLKELKIEETNLPIEINKNQAHGQLSSTVALIFAKKYGYSALDLAKKIKEKLLVNERIDAVEIAGPGFINVELNPVFLTSVIGDILEQKNSYGQGTPKNYTISLEEVSANPTGFLHVAHARNATIGDSLVRIFKFYGYQVGTEFYVNDAGNQINLLALTVFVNYLNLLGKETPLPEQCYRGEGYDGVAQLIINEKGDQFKDVEFDDGRILDEEVNQYFRKTSSDYFLKIIKEQLAQLDVKVDNYVSEAELFPKTVELLQEYEVLGATYKKDGALFLNTTKFNDDKDRVLVKSDGDYTYLTADLVNHNLRIKRTKADKLINVWGGDHHGYISRMRAGLQ